jgi:hypothetical protein
VGEARPAASRAASRQAAAPGVDAAGRGFGAQAHRRRRAGGGGQGGGARRLSVGGSATRTGGGGGARRLRLRQRRACRQLARRLQPQFDVEPGGRSSAAASARSGVAEGRAAAARGVAVAVAVVVAAARDRAMNSVLSITRAINTMSLLSPETDAPYRLAGLCALPAAAAAAEQKTFATPDQAVKHCSRP